MALGISVALLVYDFLDLFHRVLICGVQFKNPLYHRSGGLVNDQLAVDLFIPPHPTPQHMAFLDAFLVSTLDTLADFSAFIFSVHQLLLDLYLAIRVVGVQVIIKENNRNTTLP